MQSLNGQRINKSNRIKSNDKANQFQSFNTFTAGNLTLNKSVISVCVQSFSTFIQQTEISKATMKYGVYCSSHVYFM